MSNNGFSPRRSVFAVLAFDRDYMGELRPAYALAEGSEERAITTAKALVGKHKGVVALLRDQGLTRTLFAQGEILEMQAEGTRGRSPVD